MDGFSNTTTRLSDALLFGLLWVASRDSATRQASHHRLPQASMYVNLADGILSRPSFGSSVKDPIYYDPRFISILLVISSIHIWPLPKTMMRNL